MRRRLRRLWRGVGRGLFVGREMGVVMVGWERGEWMGRGGLVKASEHVMHYDLVYYDTRGSSHSLSLSLHSLFSDMKIWILSSSAQSAVGRTAIACSPSQELPSPHPPYPLSHSLTHPPKQNQQRVLNCPSIPRLFLPE